MVSPKIETEIRVEIPEHQVLLSFNEDRQAIHFIEWWNAIGQDVWKGEFLLSKCHLPPNKFGGLLG